MFEDNFSVLFKHFLFHLGEKKSAFSKVSFAVTFWVCMDFFSYFLFF